MTSTPIDGPRVLPASGGQPRGLVVLAHGYGSNGYDLISLVPFWRDALPDAVFVAPNAPEACPGAPGGRQWWALQSLSLEERSAGARRSAPSLDGFLDAELARYGLADDRVALVGFSQGTMMALHVAAARQTQIAGVVGFSGMVADEALIRAPQSRPPVLLIHGDQDTVLPISAFHTATQLLQSSGFDLTTHVCKGLGHSIDGDGIRLARDFLVSRLG